MRRRFKVKKRRSPPPTQMILIITLVLVIVMTALSIVVIDKKSQTSIDGNSHSKNKGVCYQSNQFRGEVCGKLYI
ncbi:hypothetical protein RWE15_00515 [Virgibacillus halophilus]|uniref:Uncharacterized protein n=1 Tax=Tigheibacillus halophilus TaxID=361280 RepID=A0ABU5C1M1_9BACI|nr:hypothetical protein [Virgibacillus halophilus]